VSAYNFEQLLNDLSPDNVDKIVHIPYASIIISATKAAKSNNQNDVRNKIREWK
jgi:hypothetical protein